MTCDVDHLGCLKVEKLYGKDGKFRCFAAWYGVDILVHFPKIGHWSCAECGASDTDGVGCGHIDHWKENEDCVFGECGLE